MPKRHMPRWGELGVTRVRGYGQTDDQLEQRLKEEKERCLAAVGGARQPRRSDACQRGCVLSNEQWSRLEGHLPFTGAWSRNKARAFLNAIREFHVTSRLHRADQPTRAECNAALRVLRERTGVLRKAIGDLGRFPERRLLADREGEELSAYSISTQFPARLRDFAYAAKSARRDVMKAGSAWAETADRLQSLADAADAFADTLCLLDDESDKLLIKGLSGNRDYDIGTLAKLDRLLQRLERAVQEALSNERHGGKRPDHDLVQTIAWLRRVYEQCGGKFTHTPRIRGEYQSSPQSRAGQFVVQFFKDCDPKLSPSSIGSAMEQIAGRNIRFQDANTATEGSF